MLPFCDSLSYIIAIVVRFVCFRPLIPVKHQIEYDKLVPCYPSEKLRTITLTRTNKEGLGFAVRGGTSTVYT